MANRNRMHAMCRGQVRMIIKYLVDLGTARLRYTVKLDRNDLLFYCLRLSAPIIVCEDEAPRM